MSAKRASEIAGDDERERAKREIDVMKTAVLITHSHPPMATDAVGMAVGLAEEAGWRLVGTGHEVDKHDQAAEGVERVEALPRRPDLCLVLGGDGSILYALREFAKTGVPVFGVNFGTVGFLAAVERDEAEQGIRRAFAGETEAIELPALAIEVDGVESFALNDVSFSRRPHDRVAELSYRIAGEEVGNVRCDGLVAATPAGSTGYNLANQGPILAWGVKGYVVSYISPHSLTARALVVAPGDVLSVGNAEGREPVDVAIDGAQAATLAPGATLDVRFADGVSRLAQLPGTSFYHRIREKFGHLAV
jgi:NAD+ kinase